MAKKQEQPLLDRSTLLKIRKRCDTEVERIGALGDPFTSDSPTEWLRPGLSKKEIRIAKSFEDARMAIHAAQDLLDELLKTNAKANG